MVDDGVYSIEPISLFGTRFVRSETVAHCQVDVVVSVELSEECVGLCSPEEIPTYSSLEGCGFCSSVTLVSP